MFSSNLLYLIAVWAPPVLLAITLHEAAHGWVAHRLGDDTAARLGRISINPLRHIDPLGTVVIPLAMLLTTGFVIGWAKPVPVDMRQFRQPILDMALVAVAGPLSNFAMACAWALLIAMSAMLPAGSETGRFLADAGQAGITINLILMVLNLLPIPPLDGGRVVAGVMPPRLALNFMRIEPFGMWLVIALLISGILGKILWPVVAHFETIIRLVFGL